MSKFFRDLKKSLEEVIAYQQGKLKLKSEIYEIPEKPKKYKAKDIKKIRETKKYSQNDFANILNVTTKTVQAWESGKRNPNPSSLKLIEVIASKK